MVATCGVGSMFYVLPMLLGRTYDMNSDLVGIDIYEQKHIDDAKKNPIVNPRVISEYRIIDDSSEKREFMGISGELGLKVSAGLLDIKGAGDYVKDTSSIDKSVEVLIKMTFITMTEEINPDAQPLKYWQQLDQRSVGTHVVTSLTYGGEVYASVNFIAHKAEDLNHLRGNMSFFIRSKGAFDLDAQANLTLMAQNISSKAKMEIDYYGTVPLDGVPTTLEGVSTLVAKFKEQVEKVNNGNGVILCAGFRELSEWDSKFTFVKNTQLLDALDEFNFFFTNLREAKTLLNTHINSLPERVSENHMKKVIDFSTRLTSTLEAFYKVIGNLNLTLGSYQLNKAEKVFEDNCKLAGDSRYTKEIKRIISEYDEKVEDPYKPRGIYVRWGKKTCDNKASNIVYTGYMASFTDHGIGAGFNYQCLPLKPDFKMPSDYSGFNERTSKLGGVRYRSMSMFKRGKDLEDKVAPCVVCETPMRPTIQTFPGRNVCPGDWVQESSGYLVATANMKNRAEFVCVDKEPETFESTTVGNNEPEIMPVMMGGESGIAKDVSVPCAVCSK